MVRLIGAFFLFIVFIFGAPVFAHEAHIHIMGTVTVLDADHVGVKTMDGATASILLTDDTKYRRGKMAASRADLKIGDRVVAEVIKGGDKLVASEVRFSSIGEKKGP